MWNCINIFLLISITTSLSGCSILQTMSEISDSPARQQGAQSLITKESGVDFEEIDLFNLLVPEQEYTRGSPGCYPAGKYDDGTSYPKGCETLESAWNRFNIKIDNANVNDNTKKLWRSRMQDRIIAASNQRCADFQRELHKYEGDVSFLLGGAETAFAGAGAIFTRANTVRALSGIAAILSGTKAEFSDSYYRTKTIEVVTKGLTAKRKRQRECMLRKANLSLQEYTTGAAIADAILYHGSCNVVKGLEEASDSITKVENPGQKAVIKSLGLAIEIREKADTLSGLTSGNSENGIDNAGDSTENILANVETTEEAVVTAEQTAAKAKAKAVNGDSDDKIAAAKAEIELENAKKRAANAKKLADIKASELNAKVALAKANEAAAEALAKAAATPDNQALQDSAKIAIQAAKDAQDRVDAMSFDKHDSGKAELEVCI
jgi:hypothetical protein